MYCKEKHRTHAQTEKKLKIELLDVGDSVISSLPLLQNMGDMSLMHTGLLDG